MSGSLEDVARIAGVSPATVSRALRGLPRVSAATRARVRAAADELEYVSSPSASRLASGRTGTVGVVVPYIDRWFFGKVITGVEQVLRAAGFDLLLYNLGDEAGYDRFFTDMPLRKRVDAVIVLSLPIGEAETESFRALGVPLSLVGTSVEGFADVRIDDVAGAAAAMRYLTDLGHREIALISSATRAPMHFTAPIDRRQAYLDVLDSVGVDYSPELEAVADFTMAGGERAMSALLGRACRPTAVFAESDEMAFGALRVIRRSGLRVPEDISVAGFDDHDMADLLDLTTIRQPVIEQGAMAASLLLDWLTSGEPPLNATTVLPTWLVVRGSTAPLDEGTPQHRGPQQN